MAEKAMIARLYNSGCQALVARRPFICVNRNSQEHIQGIEISGRCLEAPPKTKEPMTSGFQCAGCGEWNETIVDSSAGTKQTYVEDCQVCCKPNVLKITWDMSAGEYTISAQLE
jgi:hypothetical protein